MSDAVLTFEQEMTLFEYEAFTKKFKRRVTTDDCYTPEPVMEVVNEYVETRYGIDRAKFVRPFFPSMDYRKVSYPVGCCVVDNPPFSIISRIVRDYNSLGVKYFLFAPSLTAFSIRGCTHIITGAQIVYENGAKVATSFVTNLEDGVLARSDPVLFRKITGANVGTGKDAKHPKYKYPSCVLTSSMLQNLAKKDVALTIYEKDAVFISRLDSQIAFGKALFGQGYLLNETATAEKEEAEKEATDIVIEWDLSEREKNLRKAIGRSLSSGQLVLR